MLQKAFCIRGTDSGRPLALATISRDITERKRAEEEVRLLCEKKEVQLRVDDNGQGFGPIRPLHNGSFGLISMRKRAERLGGSIEVVSHPGRGTRVVATVPSPH